MENGIKEVELIVFGDVQGVGYRQYVAGIGRKLKLAGYVKNLKDDTVQIRCKGDEKAINEFKKKVIVKKPDAAPLIDVEDFTEKPLRQGTIKQKYFEEKYGKLNSEMSQGNTTGINYLILSNKETQANLNLFRTDTNANFVCMDKKYDVISKGMFAVVAEIKETNKVFEDRLEKSNKVFEDRIEKTAKNIESLLKILAEKNS